MISSVIRMCTTLNLLKGETDISHCTNQRQTLVTGTQSIHAKDKIIVTVGGVALFPGSAQLSVACSTENGESRVSFLM